ncbi:hypothetical protein AVEN_123424-1, partial [Araneus ventricosus]
MHHVAEGEDRYYPKEDAGAANITNMPFIYNRLKPILTRIHVNSRNEQLDPLKAE